MTTSLSKRMAMAVCARADAFFVTAASTSSRSALSSSEA
eukprot:CAMPEP_0171101024 /NCGR_PEP_ID=MMETSP0766_2-20121228/53745_1 /TAXON_ID=439317 /ORGANISM="Gambierdiscus australes, Strain CAWD 149" /LENGTH=38 /DNA_ID= /DNA_START= /DNA_END= /DNA_ORIENTATION=